MGPSRVPSSTRVSNGSPSSTKKINIVFYIYYRDYPNAWPPHQYILLQALRALPSNITSVALPSDESTFNLLPQGQLGITETQLPVQTLHLGNNATGSGPGADINSLNGTVVNGGNATDWEGWADVLGRELANRYVTSAFCSWSVIPLSIRCVWI